MDSLIFNLASSLSYFEKTVDSFFLKEIIYVFDVITRQFSFFLTKQDNFDFQVFLFRERLQYLKKHTANPYQYVVIKDRDGLVQHQTG